MSIHSTPPPMLTIPLLRRFVSGLFWGCFDLFRLNLRSVGGLCVCFVFLLFLLLLFCGSNGELEGCRSVGSL
jgi:hypothetical protein